MPKERSRKNAGRALGPPVRVRPEVEARGPGPVRVAGRDEVHKVRELELLLRVEDLRRVRVADDELVEVGAQEAARRVSEEDGLGPRRVVEDLRRARGRQRAQQGPVAAEVGVPRPPVAVVAQAVEEAHELGARGLGHGREEQPVPLVDVDEVGEVGDVGPRQREARRRHGRHHEGRRFRRAVADLVVDGEALRGRERRLGLAREVVDDGAAFAHGARQVAARPPHRRRQELLCTRAPQQEPREGQPHAHRRRIGQAMR